MSRCPSYFYACISPLAALLVGRLDGPKDTLPTLPYLRDEIHSLWTFLHPFTFLGYYYLNATNAQQRPRNVALVEFSLSIGVPLFDEFFLSNLLEYHHKSYIVEN